MINLEWIKARLLEASTWAGIGIVLEAALPLIPYCGPYAHIAAVCCGLVAIIIKDKGKPVDDIVADVVDCIKPGLGSAIHDKIAPHKD